MTYFFVGGSQRSGTTLLTTILCAGEETNPYLGESSALRSLMQTYNYMLQRFDDETAFHFGSRQALDSYYASIVSSFLSHTLARHFPAHSTVLKEPHLTMHFPHLHRLIPDSRFVLIKRDPRDIVVSMLKVGKRLDAKGKKHLFNSGDIGKIAESIVPFYRATINESAKNAAFKRKCLWVDYEQMVSDPQITVNSLRGTTGLKLELFDPEDPMKRTLAEKVASRKKSPNPEIWNTDLMREKAISSSSVGTYAEYLSGEELDIIEARIGQLITALGYELART